MRVMTNCQNRSQTGSRRLVLGKKRNRKGLPQKYWICALWTWIAGCLSYSLSNNIQVRSTPYTLHSVL